MTSVLNRLAELRAEREAVTQSTGVPASPVNADTVEVLIHDEISFWGVHDQILRDQIGEHKGALTVRIASPGGEVFEAVKMYNTLRDHPGAVHVIVDSVAASAASFLAMAGDRVTMNRASEMMIHQARTVEFGTADDMEAVAKLLRNQDNKIAAIYAARTDRTADEWLEAMAQDTWFSAEEAVAIGLADDLIALDDESTEGDPENAVPYTRIYGSIEEMAAAIDNPDESVIRLDQFKFANRAEAGPPAILATGPTAGDEPGSFRPPAINLAEPAAPLLRLEIENG